MPTRTPFALPRLDAAPLKDVARSLRFVAERSRRTLKDNLPLNMLPEPAARLAEDALATMDRLGQTAQRGVSELAHIMLDPDGPPPPLSIADPTTDTAGAEAHFAAAAHDGLREALLHLGATSALVSESAAARAWHQAMAAGMGDSEGTAAAALFDAMLREGVIRETIWPEQAALSAGDGRRVAVFAVLLAMLADPTDFDSRLRAATDMALALRADIIPAQPKDLLALFNEFRDHV